MITIIPFEEKYAADFKALNLEWLDKFGLKEEPDLAMLNNAQQEIIDPGGFIFLAMSDGEVIGSAALIREADNTFELAKMVVAPAHRGKGLSKLLINECFAKAKEIGAKRLYLVSNSQLKEALSLYEKVGFNYIPVTNSHYVTADIMMEMFL